MVSGIGMALAGAVEGWSDSKLEELKEERKRRLEELKDAAADRRAREERAFQSSEREKDRVASKEEGRLNREQRLKELDSTQEFTSGESEKDRNFRSGESDKTRKYETESREDTQAFEAGEGDKARRAQSDEKLLDRDFTSTENEKERGYQSGEKDKERKYQSEEKEKDRGEAADIVTGQDGKSYVRRGSKLFRITDEQGNPVNLATAATGKDKPAEVSTAEWLIQQGVAKDAREAWGLVRSARQDPEKSRATIYKAWMEALTKGNFGKVDGADIEKQARELTEKTVRYLETDGAEGTAPPDAGGAPQDKSAAPEKSGAAKPPGSGTADDPYVGTTQEQIDWFRKYAKPGDRITVGDKTYEQ